MRPVQQSLIDPTLERPVGPIPMSVVTGNNADLIASIASLYLTGSVLDTTYGRGMWWNRFTPDPFTFHDLDMDGVNFTALPYGDGTFDTVCFDPPYVPAGGAPTSHDASLFRDGFGLIQRSSDVLDDLIKSGLAECARVTNKWLLVKCMDFTDSAKFNCNHVRVANLGTDLGLEIWDFIVHATGTGPGGHNIFTVKRARRANSFLIVFRKSGPLVTQAQRGPQ